MYPDGHPTAQGQAGVNVHPDGRLEITVMSAPGCFPAACLLTNEDREALRNFLNGAGTA
jgi:hypothetical protein